MSKGDRASVAKYDTSLRKLHDPSDVISKFECMKLSLLVIGKAEKLNHPSIVWVALAGSLFVALHCTFLSTLG
jgi:hypothetical protein